MLGWAIVAFYGGFALIGLLNLTLMRRPGRLADAKPPLVLIPARNEERNLTELLPLLVSQVGAGGIFVFDDESDDGTASLARSLGVSVISPRESLPLGWTGKNRACYELTQSAYGMDSDWWLFLDADVRPEPDFIAAINSLCAGAPKSVGMVTGFPTILPGRGIEPLFLAWVGWILLTTNPYGVVSRSGIGHSRFKNGQMHCWRKEVYWSLQPNERVKGQIMEDVMIGRLLAKEKVGVEVANLSSVIKVKMYDRWQETLDGMSKNSFEITGNLPGALAIAAFMLFAGWGWLLAGTLKAPAYGLLLLSGFFVCGIARAAWWPILFAPIIPTIGAFTMVRSAVWHRRGTVKWKGRVYDENTLTHAAGKVGQKNRVAFYDPSCLG